MNVKIAMQYSEFLIHHNLLTKMFFGIKEEMINAYLETLKTKKEIGYNIFKMDDGTFKLGKKVIGNYYGITISEKEKINGKRRIASFHTHTFDDDHTNVNSKYLMFPSWDDIIGALYDGEKMFFIAGNYAIKCYKFKEKHYQELHDLVFSPEIRKIKNEKKQDEKIKKLIQIPKEELMDILIELIWEEKIIC